MPFYVSKAPSLVVADVAFVPNGAKAEDAAAAAEAARGFYADDPGPDVAYGASYDERLEGVDGAGDFVEVATAEEAAEAEAEAEKAAKAKKPSSK